MATFEIWQEKYRPKSLDEIINQKHIVERLKAFVKEKNIPHMLFAGPAGCGKTTMAFSVAYELYGEKWRENILNLNASDERGIDVVRGKVKDFARTKSMSNVPFRLIFLDESDALTPEAQQALRRTMETFSGISRFILAANYSSRIIEPIQSRCAVFRFTSLKDSDTREYIERIEKGEKLKIDEGAKEAIVKLSEGDLRKVSNILQASAVLGKKITEDTIYEVSAKAEPKEVKKMIEHALSGKFVEARDILKDVLLKRGVSGEDIIKQISSEIYELGISEKAKAELIEKVGEYEYRLQTGNDQIQLESMLAQFALHKKD
ncbi:MAG: replication factor C small subunit [Candidatus Aenigmatarchaeota archaeon]